MEKFEKLDNEQKELVKYWFEKYRKGYDSFNKFIEKHLTPEFVIEVGKWYKGLKTQGLVFVEQVRNKYNDGTCSVIGYGFDKKGIWKNNNLFVFSCSVKEATPEEVDQRLVEFAKSKGYKNGNYKCLVCPNSTHNLCNMNMFINLNQVWIGSVSHGNCVMRDGKWAEIIDEKAELRETIARIKTELSTLEAQL